jgi:hypothetical protein
VLRSIKRELFQNQVWHGLNFLSKALFLGVLTPYLLLHWGAERYGMYALASSLVVVLAAMDGGIRDATRLALCHADVQQDGEAFRLALRKGVMSFLLIVALVVMVAWGLAGWQVFSKLLHLPPEGDRLIVVTILLTGLSMTSVLLLEPLAARNELSVIKKINTFAALAAIPAVGLCVWLGGGPLRAIMVYFLCQVISNLWVWYRSGLVHEMSWRGLKWADYLSTYQSGRWLYLSSLVWLIRNHAVSFVVAAVTGPVEAGVFYILLRFSEVISTMGAASCETLLASLRGAQSTEERLHNFQHTFSYWLLFCGFFTVTIGSLGQPMAAFFFHHQLAVNQRDMLTAAGFGFVSAFSLLLFWSGFGLNVIRPLALWNLVVGLLTCLGCVLFQSHYGCAGTLGFGIVANLAVLPCVTLITRELGATAEQIWWGPIKRALPTLLLASVMLADAYFLHNLVVQFITLAMVAGLGLYDWKRLHHS